MQVISSGLGLVPKSLKKKFLARVTSVLASRVFLKLGFAEVSLTIVRDATMRRLNKDYRAKDKPTDVLSFAHDADIGNGKFLGSPSLGDIVISIDTAKRQAQEFEVTLLDELTRLFIHGMLHCAGFDHENVSRSEAQRMFRKQNYLMTRITGRLKKQRPPFVSQKKPAVVQPLKQKRNGLTQRRKQLRSSSSPKELSRGRKK